MKLKNPPGLSALLLSTILLCPANSAHALTYNVTSLADDNGPGELRAAIAATNASPGSTITFANGLQGTIILSPTYQALPTITVTTTIQGPGQSLIAVDGAGAYRPFNVHAPSSSVTISGLTIQHGSDKGGTGGGAISVTAGGVLLTGCRLINNIATGNGGAIYNTATVILVDCKLTGNTAYNGGALYNYSYSGTRGVATLTTCKLSGNSATINGGGIYNYTYSGAGGRSKITRCTLSKNVAGTNGAGIYNYSYSGNGGTSVIENCAFSNNSSAYGGGIYNYTYSGSGGTSSITDTSIAGNSATHYGGIYNTTYSGSGGRSVLKDCIVYGNTGGDVFGATAATYSDIQGGLVGLGNTNVNPQFINVGADNLTLKYTSPCIGAGTAVPGITTDLPGQTRTNPPTVGAYDGHSGLAGHNVLALQDSTTHQVALWTVNGMAVTSMGTVATSPGANWKVVGLADFNGDGVSDLLFQDQSTGSMGVRNLNDLVVTGSATIQDPGPGWAVVGVNDFNGDGKSDLVFEKQDQVGRQIVVWYLNGTIYAGGGATSSLPGGGWAVVGTGDFNGDGQSDLLFQKDGQMVVQYLNGLSMTGGQFTVPRANPGWNVVAVASLYGHVNPDLVFQHASGGGQAVVWKMSDTTSLQGGTLLPSPTQPLDILGPR